MDHLFQTCLYTFLPDLFGQLHIREQSIWKHHKSLQRVWELWPVQAKTNESPSFLRCSLRCWYRNLRIDSICLSLPSFWHCPQHYKTDTWFLLYFLICWFSEPSVYWVIARNSTYHKKRKIPYKISKFCNCLTFVGKSFC